MNAPTAQQTAREFLASGENRRAQETRAKPMILVPGGATSITESARRLFEEVAAHKELFYRGGAVVELVNEGNGHSVEILKPAAAQSRFEKYVDFCRPGRTSTDAWVRTTITKAQAEAYLSSEECRNLPRLTGILRFPPVVQMGNNLRLLQNGYDEETGYFVEGSRVPEDPSLEQAVEFLTGLLSGFDFMTPGDRSRAIASLLTPALKLSGLINGPIPVDVAEANASQSGKTYRQKMVAALYNHNLAVVTKRAGGGAGSMEETFSDHLAKGRTFIQFDNVRGKLDSQALESFLTAGTQFPARPLYQRTVMVDPSKFILFISSNGFEATRDLVNRACIIRINKREGHQFRSHNGKDDLQMIFELQQVWYGAVIKIIEEWDERGRPKTNDTRHDMREWCQTLDWIVQNIFQAAPLMDDHEAAKTRAASPQLTFLRTLAIAVNEAHELDQALSATHLTNLCIDKEIEIPGLSEEKQTDVDAGKKQIGTILGKLFSARNELMVENFRVTKTEHESTTDQGNPQVLKQYTFSLPPTAPPTNPPAGNTPPENAPESNQSQ